MLQGRTLAQAVRHDQREIASDTLVASEESGIDARIFKECKQTARQVRLRKSGKKVRKSLGRAR